MKPKARISPAVRQRRLLGLLADGRFHSGEALAGKLKVSRSAVWKLVRALRMLGIDIQAVPRQGYRLPQVVELYDRALILDTVPKALQSRLDCFDVLLQVDSTNRHLAAQPGPDVGRVGVCVTEVQSAGRGRRGRTWTAPFGSGICLSLSWRFAEVPPTLSALGLAVGVAIVRAVKQWGAADVGLKWPNDLVWNGRKLAGILIEVSGESSGPTRVVIGIGLNVRMPPQARLALAEQQAALVADLTEMLRDRVPGRNALVASIIEQLVAALDVFAQQGFAAFAAEWRAHDALAQAAVKVVAADQSFIGIAQGVADDGALLVNVDGEQRRYVSADVSLRAVRN